MKAQVRGEVVAETRRFGFRDIVKPLLDGPFVGRNLQMAQLLDWLDVNAEGVGVVFGRPGMGKSAVAAYLSTQLDRDSRDPESGRADWLCLRHFFLAADDRCHTHSFVRGVLLRLEKAGEEPAELSQAPEKLREVFWERIESYLTGGDTPTESGAPPRRLADPRRVGRTGRA